MLISSDWKSIEGFPSYRVTRHGAVVSLKGRTPRALRLEEHSTGYLRVTLCEKTKRANRYVHQLVAEAYHGPRPEGMEIRHLDGDRRNNAAENLTWGTHSENMRDAVDHGTHVTARRTHCPQGHPYDETNTYIEPSHGNRQCRPCRTRREQCRPPRPFRSHHRAVSA